MGTMTTIANANLVHWLLCPGGGEEAAGGGGQVGEKNSRRSIHFNSALLERVIGPPIIIVARVDSAMQRARTNWNNAHCYLPIQMGSGRLGDSAKSTLNWPAWTTTKSVVVPSEHFSTKAKSKRMATFHRHHNSGRAKILHMKMSFIDTQRESIPTYIHTQHIRTDHSIREQTSKAD